MAFFKCVVLNSGNEPLFSVASLVGKVARNSHEATLAVTMLARYGECGLRRLREAVDSLPVLPISAEDSNGSLLDVLPLHPRLVKAWLRWRGHTVGSCRKGRWGSLVKSMTDALNFLYCAGFSSNYVLPGNVRPLTRRQEAMLEHLWLVAAEFLAVGGEPFSFSEVREELAIKRLSYSGEVVSVRRSIVAELVEPVWPVIGEAAVCDITDHIEPHLAAELLNPRGCLRPVEDWPKQTPHSVGFAEKHEWYATVRAAYLRGMMAPVADEDIFKNQFGHYVLNGAMAVDKFKNGRRLQRFICCFTPLNLYTRDIEGDASTLPSASFVSRFILSKDEVLSVDGEDLQSCFNLYRLPAAGRGYMAFNLRVPWFFFDKPGGGDTFVAVTIVPMGWGPSVAISQNLLRRLIFHSNLVDPSCELRIGQNFPLSQAALACIDGIDLVSKVPPSRPRTSQGKLFPLDKFVQVCNKLGLPLSVGKAVVESYNSSLLGGEVDGIAGVLRHDRTKAHRLINKTLALLSFPEVGQAPLQHWTGVYAFAAGFRRPLYSVVQ